MSFEFGTWLGALMTLGLFSFLYKDNPLYKFCEAVFVGVSAGYWAVTFFFDNLHKKLWEGIIPIREDSDWMLIGGAILGILMLLRLIPKVGWLARWPLAFIVGATAGLYMMTYFVTNALNQIADTMLDLIVLNSEGAILWSATIGSLVVMVGVVTGLIYFFFSKEHKGLFGVGARVGIWFLMVTFGASFGYTVMSRMSLLIGRMDFLFRDWLGLLQ